MGLASIPTAAAANDIALTFKEQKSLTLLGDFIGFEENAYIIATSVGTLHIPADYVTCEGDSCITIVSSN